MTTFDAQCSRCGQPQSKHTPDVVNGGIGVGDRSVVQVCPAVPLPPAVWCQEAGPHAAHSVPFSKDSQLVCNGRN